MADIPRSFTVEKKVGKLHRRNSTHLWVAKNVIGGINGKISTINKRKCKETKEEIDNNKENSWWKASCT